MNVRIYLSILFFVIEITNAQISNTKLQVNGVFPHLSVVGDMKTRSETGIGALMPWANKLWMISYVAHIKGQGIGLYEIDDQLNIQKHPESVTGTFANRMMHDPSHQAIIGPHIIDTEGNVRTFKSLSVHRLTATMKHLYKPDSMVYFLTMEGELYEANVYNLKVKLIENLVNTFYQRSYEELLKSGIYIHFKGGYTGNNRVIVANNSYQNEDYIGKLHGGRLAEWDGKKWTILDSTAYVEVNGKANAIYGNGIWATGWDRKSVKLMFYNPTINEWRTYRLPKGSQAWEHAWNTEWMRIREAQTERFMMDVFGIFYELPVMVYGGNMLPPKPICNHLRVIPDFLTYRGMFVLAGDQIDNAIGQPQSNLLFTNIDELWKWGKPAGWGAVWQQESVSSNSISDPYLMNGFDKKSIHITRDSNLPNQLVVEVDLIGNNVWNTFAVLDLNKEYDYYIFPVGYSAKWVRFKLKKPERNFSLHITYE